MSNDTTPATAAGTTQPAGEGLDDHDMAEAVAGETSPDLDAADVFEREAQGTSTDKPAADVDADDVS